MSGPLHWRGQACKHDYSDACVDGRFNAPLFCEKHLLYHYKFAAIRDTETLYYYDSDTGAWKAGGDQIIKQLAANRAWITQPSHLNRCGASSEHSGPSVLGIPGEIDEDIDLISLNEFMNFVSASRP